MNFYFDKTRQLFNQSTPDTTMKRPHISDPSTKVFRRNTLFVMDELLDRLENGLSYVETDVLFDSLMKARNHMAKEFGMPGVTRENEKTPNFAPDA